MAVAVNARNCDELVKIRTGWGNRARETAADIEKPANDLPDATFAANCARRASIKISWANKVKGIAVGIARLAEDANLTYLTIYPPSLKQSRAGTAASKNVQWTWGKASRRASNRMKGRRQVCLCVS